MKQQLTEEQWNEVSDGLEIWNKDGENSLPTIGQLIEFLGEDLKQILRYEESWNIQLNYERRDEPHLNGFGNKELISALWEAVKYKLRTN